MRNRIAAELVGTAASFATFAVLYLALDPLKRRELVDVTRAAVRRLAGADAQAWRASPRAIFARLRREQLLAEELLEASVS